MEPDSKDLRKHMCGLRQLGLEECIRILSDRPLVRCTYCGARANSMRNVCFVAMEPEADPAADEG